MRKIITGLIAMAGIAAVVAFGIVPAVRLSKYDAELKRAASLTKEAIVLSERGEFGNAVEKYKKAIDLFQDNWRVGLVHNNLAWLLATCPDDTIRDGAEAIRHAKLADPTQWQELDTLAAAYAEAGQFDFALETISKAIQDAPAESKARLEKRRSLYRNGIPYREDRNR